MPETHFRSRQAKQKKYVTNRFGERDFILAVCTCFIHKCGRFEVNCDLRWLKNSGIPFTVDGSNAEQKCDVTIQFLVGGSVIHFAGIFQLTASV
jgi:hypothetical protein